MALALPVPAQAAERVVALVVDRSASLRVADPEGRGLRLLGLSLALTLGPEDRLALVPSQGAVLEPQTADGAALGAALVRLVESTPETGGADLGRAIRRARELTGRNGLVLIYCDDDLDVVDADGNVPDEVRERARADTPRPYRDDLNRAARELLLEDLEDEDARMVGLRAPLPRGARPTAFLAQVADPVIDLGEDELGVVAALTQALSGEARVSRLLRLEPGQTLELPYPARVAVWAEEPSPLRDAVALDGDGGRLWLSEPGTTLRAGGVALRCWVSPRLELPAEIRAYRLLGGDVRVVSSAEEAPAHTQLVVRAGGSERTLEGDPPQAELLLPGSSTAVRVQRILAEPDAARVVAAQRRVPIEPARVELSASEAQVGRTLRLEGAPPPGLEVESVPLELREANGAVQRIRLELREGLLRAELRPRAPGPLEVRSTELLTVRPAAPIVVAAAPRYTIAIESVEIDAGQALGKRPLRLRADANGALEGRLNLSLSVKPKPPEPLPLAFLLTGAPQGASIAPPQPLLLNPRGETELVLRWPAEAEGAEVGLRCELAPGWSWGVADPAVLGLKVELPPPWWRRIVALSLLALGILWGVLALRRKRAREAARELFVEEILAQRQLRTLGANGRPSPERYAFRDFCPEAGEVLVEPEDSPGGALSFAVREDGTVRCQAHEGAKVVHTDRPTVLADEVILTHGTAFAMVHGDRALRYVYLDDDPSAEDLMTRFIDGPSFDDEPIGDSGVFVLLDEDENIARPSARLDTSQELLPLPPGTEIFDSSSERAIIPEAPRFSDEGLVILDSCEEAILETDHVEFVDSDDRQPTLGGEKPTPPDGG